MPRRPAAPHPPGDARPCSEAASAPNGARSAPLPRFRSPKQLLDVLPEHVVLEINSVADLLLAQVGDRERVRDQPDGKRVTLRFSDGEGDAVNGDAALVHEPPCGTR